MVVSKRCQYALRAVYEIARGPEDVPRTAREIAEAQEIPHRFLEAILNQLRQAGIVESRRGNEGGYLLTRPASEVTVGEIIRCVEGPITPVGCVVGEGRCPLDGRCAFRPMWDRVRRAMESVYDETTMEDIREEARALQPAVRWCFSI